MTKPAQHDITALILDDHDRFRRAFAELDDLETAGDIAALSAVWDPLAALLDVHAIAEEKVFYPQLLKRGDDAEDETLDAIGDHNDIRDAVQEAAQHRVGSKPWWKAVGQARAANTEHMGEEEDEALADFRRNADLALREKLGREFLEFKRRHPDPEKLDTSNSDPQEYVDEHQDA
ncbi:MAG: hemerythrin domain-containing protein [Sporichthyaceae bacterium]